MIRWEQDLNLQFSSHERDKLTNYAILFAAIGWQLISVSRPYEENRSTSRLSSRSLLGGNFILRDSATNRNFRNWYDSLSTVGKWNLFSTRLLHTSWCLDLFHTKCITIIMIRPFIHLETGFTYTFILQIMMALRFAVAMNFYFSITMRPAVFSPWQTTSETILKSNTAPPFKMPDQRTSNY